MKLKINKYINKITTRRTKWGIYLSGGRRNVEFALW